MKTLINRVFLIADRESIIFFEYLWSFLRIFSIGRISKCLVFLNVNISPRDLYLPILFLILSLSIQFYGECWSGATAPLTYDRYGGSLHCTSEVGGMHANLVYRFVGEGQWGCLFIIFFYFYVSLLSSSNPWLVAVIQIGLLCFHMLWLSLPCLPTDYTYMYRWVWRNCRKASIY